MPWVETINEYAVTRNTDLTTAAYNIADHLREYRQLAAIEHTRRQLAVLDAGPNTGSAIYLQNM